MNLIEKKPITLAEAKALATNVDDKSPLHAYFKDFSKLTKDKADKLVESLRGLNNLKLKEEDIIKITDFLPVTVEEVNKICSESNLSEEEAQAVLNITKEY